MDVFLFVKIKDGYQSGISITQCRTNILQIIRYHFGGTITTTKSRNNFEDIMNDCYYDKYNKRNQFNLIIRSNEYQLLLEYIKNSIIIKKTQIIPTAKEGLKKILMKIMMTTMLRIFLCQSKKIKDQEVLYLLRLLVLLIKRKILSLLLSQKVIRLNKKLRAI
jgi:hypothetical protein